VRTRRRPARQGWRLRPQQTFLEGQRDFAQFRGGAEELGAWLRQILLNNLASFSRRFRETAKRQLSGEAPLDQAAAVLPSSDPGPLQRAIDQEESQRVNQALDRLPQEYRQAILLRYRDGLSFEEIGRQLQRSPNAARKLWLRAVERLRQEMDSARE
jgi:RNA polymerase sigma-70 factor (ECF subfamily)